MTALQVTQPEQGAFLHVRVPGGWLGWGIPYFFSSWAAIPEGVTLVGTDYAPSAQTRHFKLETQQASVFPLKTLQQIKRWRCFRAY